MNKEFATYEQSIALKELGFDEPYISHYTIYVKFSNDYSAPRKYNSEFELGSYISAPLKQQVFRWFREKYNLEGIPQRAEEREWYKFWIYKLHEDCKIMITAEIKFKTYEEAEDACLNKLIETVKNK